MKLVETIDRFVKGVYAKGGNDEDLLMGIAPYMNDFKKVMDNSSKSEMTAYYNKYRLLKSTEKKQSKNGHYSKVISQKIMATTRIKGKNLSFECPILRFLTQIFIFQIVIYFIFYTF